MQLFQSKVTHDFFSDPLGAYQNINHPTTFLLYTCKLRQGCNLFTF